MAETIRVRVTEVVRETDEAHSFVLERVDGGELSYRPGQFLTVRVPSDRTGHAARSYSLSSAPDHTEPAKITVKRTAGGYVSNWMCDHIAPGHELDVLRPAGVFTPTSWDRPLLLVAAGSGVTPVLSILKAALRSQTPQVTLWYANRDERSVIFAEELAELAGEHPDRLVVVHWLESLQGLPSSAALAAQLAPWASRETFVCGPAPFMEAVEKAMVELGANSDQVHVERFVSLTDDPFETPAAASVAEGPSSLVEVAIDGTTHELAWPQERALLDVLLDAGIDAPYSCREGACSACACVLLEGEVSLRRNEVLSAEDLADGIILGCQAVPLTERLRISYEE